MRALSMAQARRCENAKHKRCKCRCQGAMHGAARGQDDAFFHALHAQGDDPHGVPEPPPRHRRHRPQQLEMSPR